jgi:hypothetical protein
VALPRHYRNWSVEVVEHGAPSQPTLFIDRGEHPVAIAVGMVETHPDMTARDVPMGALGVAWRAAFPFAA